MPYTPRPQSPLGWVRLGIQLIALGVFVVGVAKLDSDPRFAYALIVVALIVNTLMVLLNYRDVRRASRGSQLPPSKRRAS